VPVARDGFPWATFAVNVSGSFALGFLLVMILERFPADRYLRPFVATGFLGAYTTYSTFAVETDLLVKGGRAGLAAAYAVVSLLGGFLAVWLGLLAARAWA
jgi:CrcB protein